jgi:hypothetical protein
VIPRVLTLALSLAICAPAAAQVLAERPVHRFEASVGGVGLGGAELGSRDADLRGTNIPTNDVTVFSTSTTTGGAPGFDGRVAFWVTRSFAVEAGFVVTRPVVRTRVTGDIEDAEDLTLEEDLDQYFVEASGVFLLDRFAFGERTVPFVSAGAGYLRQLHEGRTFIETGQVYHVGGGIRHWLRLRDMGFLRAAGLRADVRAYFLSNGFALDEGTQSHAAISGAFFVTF